jgi:uncharacterized protein (DUF58 family)
MRLPALRATVRSKAAAWARRRQGIDPLPVPLARRRLYILPTRAGLGFGALLACMLIAGLNYSNSLALLLTFLLAGFALVAMHQCHRNLLGLIVGEAATSPAFAGEQGGVVIPLVNRSRVDRYRIEGDALEGPAAIIDLASQSSGRLSLLVQTQRRGIVRVERFRICTSHPFGLFRAWTWVHTSPLEVIVYPRPHGSRPLPCDAGSQTGTAARGSGEPDAWLGLRAFREGDSPRQVAWMAYARGSALLVKEFAAHGAPRRVLDFAALPDLDTERRLEQLARWAVDAEVHAELYGLALPGVHIEPGSGSQHLQRCLTTLALHGLKRHDHAEP